jgi:hypothetical protein
MYADCGCEACAPNSRDFLTLEQGALPSLAMKIPAVWIRSTFAVLLSQVLWAPYASACCAVSRSNVPVVNADQTVIMIWDQATHTEHFIRKASFKTTGDDVGFLVPTPSRPELEASGNAAFAYVANITAPKVVHQSSGFGCGCSKSASTGVVSSVEIIEEKTVAGYKTVVLAADSGASLADWLRENDYAYEPSVAAWAQPYLDQKWLITAMKLAPSEKQQTINADALRISFKTDRPLFPYREGDSRANASELGAKDRLLRLYFIAESRYAGALGNGAAWGGKPVWSGSLMEHQKSQLLTNLRLPASTGPQTWILTEFEDHWPYAVAPADLYFSPSPDQKPLARPTQYAATSKGSWDASFLAMAVVGMVTPWRRKRCS